ncbi:hypothetical protein J8273_2323 [Carpediemonas membranifera]|uniref:Uncharacterized protein n=1 Tax=Carpediemonas membranifera TaxID=201153 RepID=A0A8J6B7N9_9EUKA|nr:hypothetical protein J8273_2323 [Carpediemonas membranifera]|eukprot:KAG9395974.1 hypothetical protein J8273_2323 [Carpediemonas membranifera]
MPKINLATIRRRQEYESAKRQGTPRLVNSIVASIERKRAPDPIRSIHRVRPQEMESIEPIDDSTDAMNGFPDIPITPIHPSGGTPMRDQIEEDDLSRLNFNGESIIETSMTFTSVHRTPQSARGIDTSVLTRMSQRAVGPTSTHRKLPHITPRRTQLKAKLEDRQAEERQKVTGPLSSVLVKARQQTDTDRLKLAEDVGTGEAAVVTYTVKSMAREYALAVVEVMDADYRLSKVLMANSAIAQLRLQSGTELKIVGGTVLRLPDGPVLFNPTLAWTSRVGLDRVIEESG